MKYKLILPIISITIMASLSGCNTADASSYRQGVAAVENGDYNNALALFDTALKEGENGKKALRGKGLSYLSMGEYLKAENLFEDALHESNGLVESIDYDISYYLAVAQFKQGKEEEALSTLNAVLAIKPDSDVATYLTGKIKLGQGKKEEAITDYNRTIELAPNNYEHYIRICEDLRDAGYKDEGDAYIEKAMTLGGKMTDAVKGELEYYQGAYTDARNDLENARKTRPNEAILLYLGKTYEALGDVDYAMGIYQEALNTYPTSGKLYNQLALTLINQKNYSQAIEIIEKGLAEGNGETTQSLMYNRAVSYEYLYDFKTAASLMREYLDKYPNDSRAEREYIFLSTR